MSYVVTIEQVNRTVLIGPPDEPQTVVLSQPQVRLVAIAPVQHTVIIGFPQTVVLSQPQVKVVEIGKQGPPGPAGDNVPWTECFADEEMEPNHNYISSSAALVTLTLPVTAIVGSQIKLAGKGSGGWRVAQNAGQGMHFLSLDTTEGIVGYIGSTNRYDSVELICITQNKEWLVKSSVGNITIE